MSIYEQNPDSDLTQELLSLKNCRKAFVGHVTKLICKIETCIFNSEKVGKILCLKEQLTVILEKLKAVNNKFISLNENAEENKSATEIFFFLSGFSFTNIRESQYCRGRGRTFHKLLTTTFTRLTDT